MHIFNGGMHQLNMSNFHTIMAMETPIEIGILEKNTWRHCSLTFLMRHVIGRPTVIYVQGILPESKKDHGKSWRHNKEIMLLEPVYADLSDVIRYIF